MSDPIPSSLQIAAGAGRICRTDHGVLFAPEAGDGWDDLVAAARKDDTGREGIAAVAQALAERELRAPAFVYVTWRPRVAVLVFGDVELRTDQPSVPMLTGARSETWVEHSVPVVGGEATLFVTPPEETDSDLQAGIVPAGGFRLHLALAAADGHGSATVPASAIRAGQAPLPGTGGDRRDETVTDAAPLPPADLSPAPPPSAATPTVSSGPVPDDTDWRPPSVDPADPEAALSAIRTAAITGEDATRPPTAVPATNQPSPSVPQSHKSDGANQVPIGAPPPTGPPVDTTPPAADPRSLVEAVHCAAGHPNPAGRSICRACGTAIPPDAPLGTSQRPSLGTLTLDDGAGIELTEDLVLGRRPDTSGQRRSVTVEGDRVSRTHAEVVLRGWEVLLRDLGSRNGTYIVPPGSSELIRVEPEIPVRLDPGTTVYLGTRSFVIDDPVH